MGFLLKMSEAESNHSLSVGDDVGEGGSSRSQVTSLGVVSRPVFMPETFSGVGRQWSDWAEQFELAAEVNGWDESLKFKFMSLLLVGRAREIFSGLAGDAKSNYVQLKSAMARCLEPCDSEDWSRATFIGRRRLPGETAREFGHALRRLVVRAYPTADDHTQDLLARDHFITHFATGDFRVGLRSAKPKTLESAITLAAEMELLKNLEGVQANVTLGEAKVRGVVEQGGKVMGMEALVGVVDELRQEVKMLKGVVQGLQASPAAPGLRGVGSREEVFEARVAPPPQSRFATYGSRGDGDGCWECGCNRHIRRNCPYLQGN